MSRRNFKEEKWIRMILNEELSAEDSANLTKELENNGLQQEKYAGVEEVVTNVRDYYHEQTDQACDLTHDQKEALYAEITSVFSYPKRQTVSRWSTFFKLGSLLVFGSAAIAATLPVINHIWNHRQSDASYVESVNELTFEPTQITPFKLPQQTPVSVPIEVFEEGELEFEMSGQLPLFSYQTLPWEPVSVDLAQPSFDFTSFDLGEDIFDLLETDVPPIAIERHRPVYPGDARRIRLDGQVVVSFIVNEMGRVVAPKIESSSHVLFEEVCLQTIRRWRFEPGEKDGEKVKVRIRMPFVFNHRPK